MSTRAGRQAENGGGESSSGGGGASGVAPGRRSLTQSLPPVRSASVQLAGEGGASAAAVHDAAAAGVAGGHESLPFMDVIQRSFGNHDVSGVQAHVGGDAAAACEDMGAQAYATGNQVAFGRAPDLHTAAHEAAHVVQQRGGVQLKGGVGEVGDAYEQHADAVADRVVAGESAEALLGELAGAGGDVDATGAVQRKTVVNPVGASKHNRLALIGDGTAANPGLRIRDLMSYVARQADWFSEPSITQADRDLVWKVLLMCEEGAHMPEALALLRTGEVAGVTGANLTKLKKYCACFDTTADTVQIHTPAPTLARALKLGQAIIDLEGFVPLPVLRIVIPESGLVYLVDKGKIKELEKYYTDHKPTLETPKEWPHIEALLNETIAANAALKGWVRDLHIITPATRAQLRANVADRSRKRPVMLILMSATDWNTAFQQAANLQASILNPKNLALLVQGPTSIANATTEVNRVADQYGQQTKTWDWNSWSVKTSPGQLGQVVIAGHGSDQSVEMGSPGTGARKAGGNRYVAYDEDGIDSGNASANGTELLIDTVLSRMDPQHINVVFAGCLVGSHDIPANTNVSNAATAQANLQAALKAHPNLADYVRDRMALKGMSGDVQAANGSTTFSSFNVDPATGRARLSNAGDPDISGSKLQYLRTGIEPEGALRAALEVYAASGAATCTAEIRTRVAGLAGNTGWWETITRTGFELCLPPVGDVDVAKLLDISHRIEKWFFGGWATMINVQNMANHVTAAEAPIVFPAMKTSSWATKDHLAVGIPEAWLKHDATQAAAFMAALTASSLTRETFFPLLARGIVDPHLATLLPLGGAKTKGQMLLALTIAVNDGVAMPAAVRDFLRDAAGGKPTSTFPAALGVGPLIAPTGELSVLENIGLAPTSKPVSSGKSTVTVDGNVDANNNGKNETFIAVSPREATVNAPVLNVRKMASTASAVVDSVKKGDVVRVMGETESGWSFIDNAGKTGFVYSKYLT